MPYYLYKPSILNIVWKTEMNSLLQIKKHVISLPILLVRKGLCRSVSVCCHGYVYVWVVERGRLWRFYDGSSTCTFLNWRKSNSRNIQLKFQTFFLEPSERALTWDWRQSKITKKLSHYKYWLSSVIKFR